MSSFWKTTTIVCYIEGLFEPELTTHLIEQGFPNLMSLGSTSIFEITLAYHYLETGCTTIPPAGRGGAPLVCFSIQCQNSDF